MSRLLLVEDEDALARSLEIGLREEGYVVDRARDGEEALWFAAASTHEALILDLRLPKIGGLEVCRRLRANGARTPILMLTACDTTEEIVAGLDCGADDYVTKPFAFAELLARLRAIARRGASSGPGRLRAAGLEMDRASHQVWRDGKEIPLSAMEFRLLEYLLLHAGAVQSRARISAALWSDEVGPDSNVLEVLVSNLRRKIDRESQRPLIHTRRNVGYLLSEEAWA
jgi:DNA-binding response OmpR family regulator